MRLASEANETTDFLRVAIMAALNLADEVFRQRADRALRPPASPNAPARLERLLDDPRERTAAAVATGLKPGPTYSTTHRPLHLPDLPTR